MTAPRRKLVIVDGANAVFRAFFAIPGMRAPDGRSTNAALGFVQILTKLIRDEAPDLLVVAWDGPGGSFRNRLYEGYKAGRDATPEDLVPQFQLVRELVQAHGIALLEAPDYEADDVIATLVAEASEFEVAIVSTDKDLLQLVSPHVTLVDGIKDRRYRPADVEARFGVGPERMLDLRALVGDPSDNIPGVKGIGEKGAAKLLLEWGSLERLLEHAVDVKAKRAREALLTQADQARMSKQLSTLVDCVSLPVDMEGLAWSAVPDTDRLRALYLDLGFVRLAESLADASGSADAPSSDPLAATVETVADPDALAALLAALDPDQPVAVELVAGPGSVVDAVPVGLALALSDDRALYAPLSSQHADTPLFADDSANEELLPILCAHLERSGWIASDSVRVHAILAERDLQLPDPDCDVGLAAFLLDPAAARGIPALALQRLGRSVESWEQLVGRGAKAIVVNELPTDRVAGWAGSRACALRALAPQIRLQLEREALLPLFEQVELPLTRVLSRMQRNGVRIDEARLAALSVEYEAELARIEAEIYALAGEPFKVNSPKQLQVILFEKLGLPARKKTKTGFSTDEGVLEQLAAEHELPARVLAWRKLAKLKSTYVDALPPLVSPHSGRIHPVFHQTGAATGRLSASNPNVQNIPIRSAEGARIREAFIPAEGCRLISADYSQVELRVLAHYSEDEILIDAFGRGEDIHRRTAAGVAGISVDAVTDDQRARAKAVNFGIIYGSSAFGLAQQLGIAAADAQQTIDAYFDRYRGVRRFLDQTVEQARQQGFVLTLMGRRRFLPDLGSRNRTLRQASERVAVNTVIQGTAADLIKRAMVDIQLLLDSQGLATRMILQVHDELVFEAPGAEVERVSDLARECMEKVQELRVPLVVDVGVGANWREAH